jgi:protoheme IX farnesyltransferase
MLPVIEPDGRSTGRQAMYYCAALLPVSLAPTLIGLATTAYFVAALVLGLLFLGLTLRFARTRAIPDARRLFFGSIVYLPVLWLLMIVFRV